MAAQNRRSNRKSCVLTRNQAAPNSLEDKHIIKKYTKGVHSHRLSHTFSEWVEKFQQAVTSSRLNTILHPISSIFGQSVDFSNQTEAQLSHPTRRHGMQKPNLLGSFIHLLSFAMWNQIATKSFTYQPHSSILAVVEVSTISDLCFQLRFPGIKCIKFTPPLTSHSSSTEAHQPFCQLFHRGHVDGHKGMDLGLIADRPVG